MANFAVYLAYIRIFGYMITQVQRVAENMAEITRQQEILTAKMRVHNKMGNCLLSARQYLAQGLPREKKPQFLDLWQNSLNALREEVAAEDEPDACEEVVRIAKSIGVDVQIHGVMPEDDHMLKLPSATRYALPAPWAWGGPEHRRMWFEKRTTFRSESHFSRCKETSM